MPRLVFPEGFLWGSASSAHQVEGGTVNDWSEWEKQNASRLASEATEKFGHTARWEQFRAEAEKSENYISGRACEHYSRFREDFDLARSFGHSAHRFSIEWSRIEPEKGRFDEAAVEHYREVLLALQERGLEPFVTLWHWTIPLWLAREGGHESRDFPAYFERYARFVVARLSPQVRYWMTLNEPTSVIAASFATGQWPPQKKSLFSVLRVFHILARAHRRAFRAIHELDPGARVGIGHMLHSFEPYRILRPLDALLIRVVSFFTNDYMLLLTGRYHDYLGVQYYFHNRFKFPRKVHHGDKPETDLGWEIYPEGIYRVLMRVKRLGKPVYITENGLADAFDDRRPAFIREHLAWVHRAISEGVPVRGYFYWSLLDNFEWDKGFWPRFGLVEVDYATMERRPRPSAYAYADICRENALDVPDGS